MIEKGEKKIGDFSKGANPLSKFYKGDKLVWQKEDGSYNIRIAGYFDTATEDKYYVWINGTQVFLPKKFDYKSNEIWQYGRNTSSALTPWFGNRIRSITKMKGIESIPIMDYMFYSCSALSELNISDWDTSNVTSMKSMFSQCAFLSLKISDWNVSNVKSMQSMFSSCSSLWWLDLSDWDVSNVTSMSNMFKSCKSLQILELSNWKLNAYCSLTDTFAGCTSLRDVRGSISSIHSNLSLSDSPLYNDSAMVFINGLNATTAVKYTITFSSTTYSTLSTEQIAIATSKGWTVASA